MSSGNLTPWETRGRSGGAFSLADHGLGAAAAAPPLDQDAGGEHDDDERHAGANDPEERSRTRREHERQARAADDGNGRYHQGREAIPHGALSIGASALSSVARTRQDVSRLALSRTIDSA